MITINRNLDEKIGKVDYGYLTDDDLSHLENFSGDFSTRVKTYNLLRDSSEELILRSLNLLAQKYPDLMKKHGLKCKYDMSIVMRYLSIGLLRDDEVFFRDSLIDWHSNIIQTYKISVEVSMAYSLLLQVIEKIFPVESYTLVKPYLEIAISAFLKA